MNERKRILVVDDEPINLKVVTSILKSAGCVPLEATSGQECLEMARRERPDIILLDVMLPDILGPEVSARIKGDAELEDIYIILTSEKRVSLDDRVEGLVGGADAYLPRPFTREELLAYVISGTRTRRLIGRLKEEIACRERTEMALREAERERSRLQKLEEEQRWAHHREMLQKDLHDGIGGITTNISLLAELGKRARTTEEIRETLETIGRLAREGLTELRSFMNALERKEVSWTDLVAEMRRYGTTMLEPHDLALEVHPPNGPVGDVALDLYLYMSLLSVFKEAVANVVKHAQARSVTLSIDVDPNRLSMSIIDDGAGLPPSPPAGRGLQNMRTRARDLGATLVVGARGSGTGDGRGTEIRLEMPLPALYSTRAAPES